MKVHLFFAFHMLLGLSLQAQDWNLVTANGQYNFGATNLVSRCIRVTNAIKQGQDSVFLVSPRETKTYTGSPYITDTGNLLGDTIVKSPNFVYSCRFRPNFGYYSETHRTIKTKAAVGESWSYQNNITASVSAVKDTLCWGIADSLKIISLSNGKTLRLSKHFGLLNLADYQLIGINGKNIGIQLPRDSEWFADWQPGAVLQYYYISTTNTGKKTKQWTKKYVLTKSLVAADSIIFCLRTLRHTEETSSAGVTTVTNSDEKETFGVIGQGGIVFPEIVKGSNTFVSTAYSNSSDGLTVTKYDIITPSSSSNYSEGFTKTLGLGMTRRTQEYSLFPETFSSEEKLVAYKKVAQDAVGTLLPDSFFGVVSDVSTLDSTLSLSLYPNPVSAEILHITCSNCQPLISVEWMDITGSILSRTENLSLPAAIPTGGLSRGTYLLRLRFADNKEVWRKIFVL